MFREGPYAAEPESRSQSKRRSIGCLSDDQDRLVCQLRGGATEQ